MAAARWASAVAWEQPWLIPYHESGRVAAAHIDVGSDAAESLASVQRTRHATQTVRFVGHQNLSPHASYEGFIAETGTVPTRDNLHDFFNGLAWLHFPQTKRRLNELQAAEIDKHGIGASRGPVRDALTLFDENGAVFDAPPALWEALLARDWRRLFVTERARWADARLLVFGHALLEKLTVPRKGLTAHVLFAPGASQSIYPHDESIAEALSAAHLATKPFVPLPVLGVPGWWPENANPCFYDDLAVFRPHRFAVPDSAPSGPA